MALRENTLFGTLDRITVAIERLQSFCPPEGYWVAISGGKDSTVIYDLCKRSGCLCEYHYHVTGLDPPLVPRFMREHMADVAFDKPPMTFVQLFAKKAFPPLRSQAWCCELLKEHGGKGRVIVDGVRAEESPRRKNRRVTEFCLKGGNRTFVHPILDWSTEDVWKYIKQRALPYLSLYDEGWSRVGCVGCPRAAQENRIRDMKRFPKIAEIWHRATVRAFNNRDGKPKLKKWNTGEELWEWWVKGAPSSGDPAQTTLYE